MKSELLIKSLIGAFILTFLGGIFNTIMGLQADISYYLWSIPANFLVALILGYYILHSKYKGIKLCIAVFIIYFITGQFNILNEAWIFNVTDRYETTNQIINGFFITLLFTPIYVYLFGKWKGQSYDINFVPRSIFSWIWRISVADILYFLIYFIAGFILQAIYPKLLEFYEGNIPPFDLLIKTQFLRGLIFAGITLLVLRTTDLKLIKRMLLIGAVFSILGGIAPLIPPNEFMPLHIRLVHGVEVGISNFVYGLIAGYLLGQKRKHDLASG